MTSSVARDGRGTIIGFADGVVAGTDCVFGEGSITRLGDSALLASLARGVSLADLRGQGTTIPGFDVDRILATLCDRRLLAWRFEGRDGVRIAVARPRRRGVPWPAPSPAATDATDESDVTSLTDVSRFALLRPHGQAWLLESGASDWLVELAPEALRLLASQDPQLFAFLGPFGMLADADQDPALVTWEFHDCYFASRSRVDGSGGGTYRFAGKVPAPRARVSPAAGRVQPLPEPARPGPTDFWEVVDRRRSTREFQSGPLDVHDLSDVLWHTVRQTRAVPADPAKEESYDGVFKPVPSAGATHAVDLWVATKDVAGVEPAVWWYDAVAHALVRAGDLDGRIGFEYPAPVKIIMMSRHSRLAWKYEGIAYALALKDVGVIMGALQLVATAMGLGAVPIGSGPSSLAAALGVAEFDYAPVGELLLGRPATGTSTGG